MSNENAARYLDEHLSNFIDALENGQGEDALRVALQALTIKSGFSHFAYSDLRAGDNRAFSNYPAEWRERYLSMNYYLLDPVVVKARRAMRPTSWSIDRQDRYRAGDQRMFAEAADFGIMSGIVLPIKGGFGRTAMLALASDSPQAGDVAVRDMAHAATAVTYVHLNMLRFSSDLSTATDGTLSPREQHCLTWASLGKTQSETARMIGITEKTVRFYLERARDKLNAVNTTHAVRIAVERGLL